MTYYDEQLQQLQAQTARAKQLESMLRELRGQQTALSARVQELEAVKRKEQVDVDRLEGRSLAAFFCNVIGKMDERLNKERQESYAARVKCAAAAGGVKGSRPLMLTPQQGSICRKDKTAFCTCDMAGAPQRPLRFLCSLMCPFLFRQICNRTVCSPVCKLNGPALRCDCAEQGRFVSAKIKI